MLLIALHPLKVSPLLTRVHRHVGLLLLVHLPLVHHLLDRPRGEEAIHVDVAPLPDAVRPVLRLCVLRRVPVGVEDDDSIRRCYVQPDPAGARR